MYTVQVERCTAGGGLILMVDIHVPFYFTGGEMYDGRVYSIGKIFALILSCWIVLNRSWPECKKADIPG